MFPKSTKILIVDDMAMFRQMVKDALTTLELPNFTDVVDGQAAWQALNQANEQKTPFHLVIADWNMPNMNGIQLLKNVRSTKWCSGLPFILLTGVNEKNNILEAIENKVSQYIVKPFSVVGLKEKLDLTYNKAKALGDQWVPMA